MTILIFISVVLVTGGVAFLFSDKIKTNHKLFSTFSAAVVATLIFVHILPEIYSSSISTKWLGTALLVGLILQLVLEKITHGVEHDHEHSHAKNHKSILIGVMLGLGIHSMIEGMPISMDEDIDQTEEVAEHAGHDHEGHDHGGHDHESVSEQEHDHGHEHFDANQKGISKEFISAVLLHKVPVTIVLSLFLISVGVGAVRFFLLIGIFSLMTPLGMFLGEWLSGIPAVGNYRYYLVAISTGMLLHIITSILFEHGHSRKETNLHILLIVMGITLGILLF